MGDPSVVSDHPCMSFVYGTGGGEVPLFNLLAAPPSFIVLVGFFSGFSLCYRSRGEGDFTHRLQALFLPSSIRVLQAYILVELATTWDVSVQENTNLHEDTTSAILALLISTCRRLVFFSTFVVPLVQKDLRIDYNFAYPPFYLAFLFASIGSILNVINMIYAAQSNTTFWLQSDALFSKTAPPFDADYRRSVWVWLAIDVCDAMYYPIVWLIIFLARYRRALWARQEMVQTESSCSCIDSLLEALAPEGVRFTKMIVFGGIMGFFRLVRVMGDIIFLKTGPGLHVCFFAVAYQADVWIVPWLVVNLLTTDFSSRGLATPKPTRPPSQSEVSEYRPTATYEEQFRRQDGTAVSNAELPLLSNAHEPYGQL